MEVRFVVDVNLSVDPHLMALLLTLTKTGDRIMAQLDDLKAALAGVSTAVDALGVEVADLIAKLSTTPPPTDLTEVIGMAQSIADKLAAIPPEPK
jgi:hypothetical protein